MNLHEYHWVSLHDSPKIPKILLHIRNTEVSNKEIGMYDSGTRRMRTMCGAETGHRKRVENLDDKRFCKHCLAAIGVTHEASAAD